MQHWFYSTLAAGVLFIASVELMLFGFCYVFFFLDVETTSTAKPGENNGGGRAVSMTQGGSSSGQRPAGGARSYGDGGAGGSSHTGRLSTGGGAGSSGISIGRSGRPQAETEAATATGRGFAEQGDEGLRRRRAASASAAAAAATTAAAESGDAGRARGASSASSAVTESAAAWGARPSPARRQPSSSTIPPGVQAYQRGARYIVQPRGGGVRPVDLANGRGPSGAGAGASGAGGGGGGSGADVPRAENLSQADIDAAAMASWAALDGNVADTRRGGVGGQGEGRLHGTSAGVAGRGVAAQGVRVVEPVPVAEECEPLHQPHGSGTPTVYVEGEGEGGEGAEGVASEGRGVARGQEEGVAAGRRGLGSSLQSLDDDDNW